MTCCNALRVVLFACALGCGDRSALDGVGIAPAAGYGGQGSVSSSSSGAGPGCGSPSCQPGGPGMTDCGPSRAECCCTSLEVTGGTFHMTYMNLGNGPMAEADPATVSGFRLDKYEVTVGRFRRFMAAWDGGWLPAADSGQHVHLTGG
jgi:sulfatase modifying factor 1